EKARRGPRRRRGGERLQGPFGLGAEEPEGLRGERPRCPVVVGPPEVGRGQGKDPTRVAGGSAGLGKQPAAVGIADRRQRPVRESEPQEGIEQALDPISDGGRYGQPVPASQDQEVEVELRSVALVTGGLLELSAVEPDLTGALGNKDAGPQVAPTGGVAKLG